MKFLAFLKEPLREALRSLWAHKVRSFLTALGIIIGVASVVAVMQFGKSLEGSILLKLQAEGTYTFWFNNQPSHEAWKKAQKPRYMAITEESMQELRSLVPELRRWTFGQMGSFRNMARYQTYQRRSNLWLTDEHHLPMNWLELAHGRGLTSTDRIFGKSVAVLGAGVAEAMGLNGPEALGRSFSVGPQVLEVVGILKPKGNISSAKDDESSAWSEDSMIYLPYTTGRSLMSPRLAKYRFVTLEVEARQGPQETEEKLRQALRGIRGLLPGDPENFVLEGKFKFAERNKKVTQAVMLASALMVGISMVVGGIGVMNIMLVSVTERTREIGLRKALGARRKLILTQFLVEAALLCALGGLLGLVLGLGLGSILGHLLLGFVSAAPLWSLGAALAVPTLSGLSFGFYPALRASRLDPIEALRAE